MRGDLFALFLLVGGLACILAWAVCQSVVALRSNRLRRATDAIKMHLIKGGRMPEGEPRELARDYFHLRWLGILGNCL
ncbi:MAG: hypothetical protein GTN90_05515, partial [Xanthomonadales bacterium]|nr:hypothetical protein [Xanthomonadales bacterium]